MNENVDQRIGGYLANSFRHQSRRSFLSRLTRGLFALAGITLPATLAPRGAPTAQAQGGRRPWYWCGLHGYICAGNCANNAGGNRGREAPRTDPRWAWVGCCKDPADNKWYCILYPDVMGVRGPRWGQGCPGTRPAGAVWGGRLQGQYICTKVYHPLRGGRKIPYASNAECRRNCYPGLQNESPA
jgi:hypothetical protein